MKFRLRSNCYVSFANIARIDYGYLNKANLLSVGHLISLKVKCIRYFPFAHPVPFSTLFVSQDASQYRLHEKVTYLWLPLGLAHLGHWQELEDRKKLTWDSYLPCSFPCWFNDWLLLPIWRLSYTVPPCPLCVYSLSYHLFLTLQAKGANVFALLYALSLVLFHKTFLIGFNYPS